MSDAPAGELLAQRLGAAPPQGFLDLTDKPVFHSAPLCVPGHERRAVRHMPHGPAGRLIGGVVEAVTVGLGVACGVRWRVGHARVVANVDAGQHLDHHEQFTASFEELR